MVSTTSSVQATDRVAFNRLLWVGPFTILAAIVANVIIQQIAVAVLRPDPAFMPLTLIVPIVFTFVGVLGTVRFPNGTEETAFSTRHSWLAV